MLWIEEKGDVVTGAAQATVVLALLGDPFSRRRARASYFACSTDNTIYFGPGNLEKIVQSGDGAVKFTAAHKIGHHVQFMLDPSFATSYRATRLRTREPGDLYGGGLVHRAGRGRS